MDARMQTFSKRWKILMKSGKTLQNFCVHLSNDPSISPFSQSFNTNQQTVLFEIFVNFLSLKKY